MQLDPNDIDLEAMEPSTMVKASAALHAFAGLFVALTGLQLVGTRFVEPMVNAAPMVLLLLGITLVVLGAQVYRAKGWTAVGGVVLGGVGALTAFLWLGFSFVGGIFSLMALLAVPVAGLAFLAALLARKDIVRVATYRQRLSDQGLDLGF
ncbi:MAG: hypothetical protein AAGH15_24650 [Myxococcota bacterium]